MSYHRRPSAVSADTVSEEADDRDEIGAVLASEQVQYGSGEGEGGGEEGKKKRKFTRRQYLMLATLCTLHFATLACYSLIAPFYPNEVRFMQVCRTKC